MPAKPAAGQESHPGQPAAGPGNAAAPGLSATAGGAAAEAVGIPRRVSVPPQPYDRGRMWLGIIVSLLVCLPPLLVNLGSADVSTSEEAQTLLTSRETWQRWHAGQTRAWLIPSHNGQQAVADPPMVTWLHMLGWADLTPGEAKADTLVVRARLVSVVLAVLALMSTYWAGMSLGGPRIGLLSSLVLGTTLLFIYQSRFAASQPVVLGWVTLAIAAGLWAMRPLKPINWVSRRVSGWLIAGVALGAAFLTKGPEVLVFFLPPMIAAVVLTPQRRMGNALGLTFAVFLGILAATPWYLYILDHVPDAWARLRGRFDPPDDLFVISWSHARVVAMLAPWIVFLFGGLFQPFLRSTGDYRRQLLIGWMWFVLIFIALSMPAARHPRFITPLLPAAAILVGQLFAYHVKLASERQQDPGVNLLRVPHWLAMLGASILGPLFIAYQEPLVKTRWIEHVELPGLNWLTAMGLGVALTLIAVLGTRWHFKWQPRMAAYATVAWMLTASTLCFHAYAQSYHRRYDHRTDAMRIANFATPDKDIVLLVSRPDDSSLSDEFLFYVGRVVRSLAPQQLPTLATPSKLTLVVTSPDPATDARMDKLGFVKLIDFTDGHPRRLYQAPRPAVRTTSPTLAPTPRS